MDSFHSWTDCFLNLSELVFRGPEMTPRSENSPLPETEIAIDHVFLEEEMQTINFGVLSQFSVCVCVCKLYTVHFTGVQHQMVLSTTTSCIKVPTLYKQITKQVVFVEFENIIYKDGKYSKHTHTTERKKTMNIIEKYIGTN